jgi:cytochrome c553
MPLPAPILQRLIGSARVGRASVHRAPIGRLATIAAGLLLAGNVVAQSRSYIDLRYIEPVHGDAAAGEKKATLCVACHGANGNSSAPIFPRLAGQREDYLYHRLVSFKYADPKDPYYAASPMTANATALSDADMRDLAAYFAGQAPPAAPVDPAAPVEQAAPVQLTSTVDEVGQRLFNHGDPALGIPPCLGCHGADARGPAISVNQYAAWPALRGQYAPYLSARLSNFRRDQPADTSNSFIMHGIAHTLDDASIQALADWLSSLPPG